ncbi:hypothetical protein DFJ74DRAFT_700403 [Hyaloraphidium curvatum]|nr:hypothetical protein DFJ74DRAFT_700403 [Hyaloraphidium curvatum]
MATNGLHQRADARVGIIGGGVSGIVAAIYLRDKLGIKEENIIGVERNPELGGTWFEVQYPGLSCDIPAPLYSFSFAMNPNWSRPYPPRQELNDYICRVADVYDVRKLFRFNCATTRGVWNEEKGVWTVFYKDLSKLPERSVAEDPNDPLKLPAWARISNPVGPQWPEYESLPEEQFEVEFLVHTQRTTGAPGLPDIPGATEKAFKGLAWHSMRWPENGLELVEGKRVALIGCAAAAVQLVPALQPTVSHLTVFHRTPNHVRHRDNRPFTDEQKKEWRSNPMAMRQFREGWFRRFFKNWHDSGVLDGSEEQAVAIADSRSNLYDNVKDERLRRILWPDYKPWGRRMTFHDEFYPALTKPNVEVVQDRIVRIDETGIVTAAQDSRELIIDDKAPQTHHDFDVIVYATGWAAMTGKKGMTPFFGRGGLPLEASMMNVKFNFVDGQPVPDLSELGIWTYMGQMYEGFPNLFSGCGPSTFTLGASIIDAVEDGMDWTVQVLRYALGKNARSIEPTREAIADWTKRLDERVKNCPVANGPHNTYYKVYRPDGTFTTRMWFPGDRGEIGRLLRYPIVTDFKIVPKPEGEPRWNVPCPPAPSMLDELAFKALEI